MKLSRHIDWLFRLVKGVIMALGFILPGISGATVAAILGLYERILNFLANIRKDFKKNFLFFLPVGIGGILGIGLLSGPLGFLVEHYPIAVLWGFVGVIVGTMPKFLKESTRQRKRKAGDVVTFLVVLVVSFLFLYFMGDLFGTIPANFGGFIVAGAILAFSVLVPGLSSSNLLIVLGLYTPMLAGFSEFDLAGVFLPMFIGGCALILIFSKMMDRLLQTFHTRTYHGILGIIAASTVLMVMPPIIDYSNTTGWLAISGVVAFGLGILLGWKLSRWEVHKVDE